MALTLRLRSYDFVVLVCVIGSQLVAKEFKSQQDNVPPAHVYTFSAFSNEHLEPEGIVISILVDCHSIWAMFHLLGFVWYLPSRFPWSSLSTTSLLCLCCNPTSPSPCTSSSPVSWRLLAEFSRCGIPVYASHLWMRITEKIQHANPIL